MKKTFAGLMGAMLLLSFSAVLVTGQATDYIRSYNDPADQTSANADIIYVGSALSGGNIVLTLRVQGTIDTANNWYTILAGDEYSDYSISYSSLLDWTTVGSPTDYDILYSAATISGNTLTITVASSWAGPAADFDVEGSTVSLTDISADAVGGEYWATGETGGDTGGGGTGTGTGEGAQLPEWNIGDGWYFGKTWDFDAMQAEIDAGLNEAIAELPGFDADATVAGGVGLYFGVEVVDDDYDLNGVPCYQVDITGALGVDFGLDAFVKGSVNEDLMQISVDATADAVIVAEANLEGSLFFTVDELAFARGEFTISADGQLDVNVDADVQMSMDLSGFGGGAENVDAHIVADVHGEVNNAQLTGSLECDPAIDFFDFPIMLADQWQVPNAETDVTGSWSGSGTISWNADVTGISAVDPTTPDIHESDSVDLAQEIGSGTVNSVLDPFWDGVTLRCTQVIDNKYYIIEANTGEIFNYIDFSAFGVKQYGIDPMDMIGDVAPQDAGVQFDADSGFVTGMTVDGEVMTTMSTAAEVDAFAADPLGDVQDETGGHGTVGEGGGIFSLLIIGIILIVVVLVVVMVVVSRRKRKGPEEMYGAPPQQQPQYYQQQDQTIQHPQDQTYQHPPQQQQPPPPPPPQGY